MRLRAATRQDQDAIHGIADHYIKNSNYNLLTQPRSRGEMAQWFLAHDAQHPIWVAEEQGRIVGWASLSPFRNTQGYASSVEYSIYLHPGYLGKGVGTLLTARMLTLAKELGYTCVVSLITASNQPSIRLHQRMGFELVGRMRQVASKFGQSVDVVTYQYFVGQPGVEQIARLTEQARRAGVRAIPLGREQLRYDGRQRLVCAYKCPNHAACGRVEPEALAGYSRALLLCGDPEQVWPIALKLERSAAEGGCSLALAVRPCLGPAESEESARPRAQGLGLCWEALCQQMDVQLRPEAQALLLID